MCCALYIYQSSVSINLCREDLLTVVALTDPHTISLAVSISLLQHGMLNITMSGLRGLHKGRPEDLSPSSTTDKPLPETHHFINLLQQLLQQVTHWLFLAFGDIAAR